LAVRIYSLAKELKVDSKELVDLCTQIGITGKGSALASLSEDEVVKIQDYFKGSGPKSAAKGGPAAPAAPERPRQAGNAGGRMPVIVTPKPSGPLSSLRKLREDEQPTEPEAEAEQELDSAIAAEAPAVEESAAAAPPAPSAPAAPAAEPPRSHGPLAGVMRRDDYVGPGNMSGKPPVFEEQKPGNRGGSAGKPAGSPPPKARPAIKLAPMPTVEPPKPVRGKAGGEQVMKPDMKLPADAMRAGKSGSKPLAAHLRRHEDAVDAAKKAKALEEENAKAAKRGGRGSKPMIAGKEGEGGPLLGGREERQLARRRTTRPGDDDRPVRGPRRARPKRRSGVSSTVPRKERISIQLPCTVRELSAAAGVPGIDILRILMSEGAMATLNTQMDPDMTELIAAELGITIDFKAPTSLEEEFLEEIRSMVDPEDSLVARPPVITFLGHVDHGKTSLIDKIIGINVVSGESGGITQHIRAYQVDRNGKRISFVDTPGHEAFTEMRARGANVTDIAVIVVAADDGVMPQTEEAISHARAAEVPIVIALNKTDLPGIDFDRIYQQLATNDLLPSEWGGDVEVVKTSATTGAGIENLLDTLLTVAELHEYKANPSREALGTCLEAQQMADRGVMAKVMVQNGTLHVGDVVVCGDAFGRVKSMDDTLNSKLRHDEAPPSMPVNIWGLDIAPAAGEHFYVLDDIGLAREIAEARAKRVRSEFLSGVAPTHVTLENLFDRLDGAVEVSTLNIILRADTRGSIEAIRKELGKLEHPEVKLRILQAMVGGVSEADVMLADASDAIVIGFNVVPDERAKSAAEQRGVQIRRYDVIYKIADDLKQSLEGMLKPEEREVDLGRALVQQVYKISRVGAIAGCRVLGGIIARDARVRIIRDNTVVGDYAIDTLKREKDDAKEVREGLECGIKIAGFNDVKEGDLLEAYRIEEIGRKFDS
jgi:translation initiation factor IF-2